MPILASNKILDAAVKTTAWVEETNEDGENAVGLVMTIVEVKTFVETDEGRDTEAKFMVYCTDGRRWIQVAALKEAMDLLEASRYPLVFDPEPDEEE